MRGQESSVRIAGLLAERGDGDERSGAVGPVGGMLCGGEGAVSMRVMGRCVHGNRMEG